MSPFVWEVREVLGGWSFIHFSGFEKPTMRPVPRLRHSSAQVQPNLGSSSMDTDMSRLEMVSGSGGPIQGGQSDGGSSCMTLRARGGRRSWCIGPATWGGRCKSLMLGRGGHTSLI